jgi:hypothetical protein
LADKCCKDVEAEENGYPIMMFGVMAVAGGLRSDCQSTINKKGVKIMQKIPEWRRINALGDAVSLLMIIGVITVAIWLLSHSG